MTKNTNFERDNISTMSNLGDTLYKMNNILNEALIKFKAVFGKSEIHEKSDERHNQIYSHDRFIVYKTNILENTYSDICIGFSLKDSSLIFTFCMIDEGKSYHILKKYFENDNPRVWMSYNGKEAFSIVFAKQEIIKLESELEIIKWFEDTIEKFMNFTIEIKAANPEIVWLFK